MIRTTISVISLVLAGSVLAGCTAPEASSERRTERTVITAEELAEAPKTYTNAYQLVQRLRPQWLQKRSSARGRVDGTGDPSEVMEGDIVVYLDGSRLGGPGALRSISADGLARLEYLGAAQAVRLGTGHQHGAILVETQ